jgi:hypothetical protein
MLSQAACLLENLEPSTHPKDPRISAWMDGLCAAIRTGDLEFIKERQQSTNFFQEGRRARRQRQDASSTAEIPKAALMDFAKRNSRDLEYLINDSVEDIPSQ